MGNRNQTRRCGNCGAANIADARQCVICGAVLIAERRARTGQASAAIPAHLPGSYDSAEGEDDLLVRGISDSPLEVAIGLLVLAALIGAAIVLFLLFGPDGKGEPQAWSEIVLTGSPTMTALPTALPTNTRSAPLVLPTITPLPDTPTPTPTQGPCVKTAKAGDTLYGLAQQCGHRHLSVVNVIVQENGLSCASCLREGQTINIPWPTPTLSDDTGAAVPEGEGGVGETVQEIATPVAAVNEFGTPDALATFSIEPTLRPGLMWHTIQEGENLIIIAGQYNADAKVLSDLNPEVEFSQCDFSARYGGPECIVILVPGKRLRVPAPTPTPTLSPTPSGSETPTPTPTPTFNVPVAYSPEDKAVFRASSLVTLRWSASGTLGPDEQYVVRVRDLETGVAYQFQTVELFYVMPDEVQPRGRQMHNFEWTVSIALVEGTRIISTREETPPRRFAWQGRP